MRRTLAFWLAALLCLSLILPAAAMAESAVPDALPDDLGGKTLYGYLMDLKNLYMPAKVFQDATKYSDVDRENARRAARLMIDATTKKMEQSGTEDQYNLYLRAYAYDLLFQDTGDEANRLAGLSDYEKTVAAGGAYAQADYDRLTAMEVKAAPLAWRVDQMLTAEEMGETVNVPAGDLVVLGSSYATADGSRRGAGYTLRSIANPAQAAVYVLADPQGGKARYDLLKGFAFLRKVTDLPGLGDEAVSIGLRNMDNDPALYTTVLARKGDLVLQVRMPDAAWRGAGFNMDPARLTLAIAAKVLANLYDTGRALPVADKMELPLLAAGAVMDAGDANSPVPDAMPADLGGKTEYGYLVEIRQKYLPADAFTNEGRTDGERNDARRAARLIAESLSKRFDEYGQNPYELEIRGACYAAAYADTGLSVYRKLAINDYRQAISYGYALAKADYDRLAAPLLEPLAEMLAGTTGGNVALLQQWLTQAGYGAPQTMVYDEATRLAVEAYEGDNGLARDGIADIAFLLSLYAKVDDGAASLPGEE